MLRPWLFDLGYSSISQLNIDLGVYGEEEASSSPSYRVDHAVRPRAFELVFQQGGSTHSRLQFVELPEPLSSKIQD